MYTSTRGQSEHHERNRDTFWCRSSHPYLHKILYHSRPNHAAHTPSCSLSDWNQWDSRCPQFPPMVLPTLIRRQSPVASPSLRLAGTTYCWGGDPIHPPQIWCSLWQNCSALDCTEQGTIQAVVCEGWGPATLIPPNISWQGDRERQKKRGQKRRGGKIAPEVE